jgi:hypothetical protein
LWDWFNNGGCAKVYGWLLARDISEFDPREPAAMTGLKAEMIRNALPLAVRWCLNQFEEGGPFEGRTVITIGDILSEFERSRTAPRDMNSKWAASALGEAGFTTNDKLRVRIEKEIKRLWINDPSGLMAQLSPDKLKERYLTEQLARKGDRSTAEEDFA